MADRSFAVRILADAGQYLREIRTVHDETQRLSQSVEQRLQAQGQAYQQVGAAATIAGGLIVTGLGLAAKAAIDWESAWAGVMKTVDASPETFAVLEQDLRDLAGVLPATHAEIAAVAEAAGQLGVSAENIPAFTKVMIDMGEATNLSSDQAATSLARFMNVMGTAQGDVGNLGSAVVALGNNYATTEAEIVEMSQRLAGAGVQVGLSEGEVLGLATALSSVGIEAEAGGSAMSKVMIDIAASVEEGGDRLDQFATVAGVSATTFADHWRTDPGAALAMFVQGLADAETQGQSTLGILADLGITEVRMRDALLRSASASDVFTEAMQHGNEAFADGTALADEAARRYETLGAQFEITRNKIVDTAITFGETLTPAIGGALDMVGGLAEFLGDLPAPLQGAAVGIAAVTGAVLLTGGTALLAIPKIAEFRTALSTLGITAVGTKAAVEGALAAVGGPAIIAIGAAVLAVGALVQESERARATQAEWNAALMDGVDAAGMFRIANESWGKDFSLTASSFDAATGDMVANLDKIPGYLDLIAARSENAWAALNPANIDLDNSGFTSALGQIEEAIVAVNDAATQQESFRELAGGMELTRDEAENLLAAMPDLREAFIEQATAADVAITAADGSVDSQALLAYAYGETESAAGDAISGIEGVGEASETAAGQAQELLETQQELADLWLSAVDATAAFEQTIDDIDESFREAASSGESLAATWDETAGSFDVGTQAGRDAHVMLKSLVDAGNAETQALIDRRAPQEEITAAQNRSRDAIARVAGQLDSTGRAAQTYTGLLNAIPDDILTAVELETARAEAAANGFVLRHDGRRIKMYVDTYGGTKYQVPGTNGQNTGVYFNAQGALMEFMAQGGLSPMSTIAQMVPPNSWRVVGDRSDVDEAYIPIDRSPRSFSLLDETIRRMGARPFAEGGFFDGYGSRQYGQPQPVSQFNPVIQVAAPPAAASTDTVTANFYGIPDAVAGVRQLDHLMSHRSRGGRR